jgi:hypothetical protein
MTTETPTPSSTPTELTPDEIRAQFELDHPPPKVPTADFSWEIIQLNCYPEVEGKTNVVFSIYWRCVGKEGSYHGIINSNCEVPLVADAAFTPYAELTKDQILQWVWASGASKESVEFVVQSQIDAQHNSSVITPALPWLVSHK